MEPRDEIRQAIEETAARMRDELISISLGEDALLTEEEAARLLGVSPRTLRRMRDSGEIKAGFIGKFPRYSLGQIRRYARATVSEK